MKYESLRVFWAETASALRRTPLHGGNSALPSVTQPTASRLHRVHSHADFGVLSVLVSLRLLC